MMEMLMKLGPLLVEAEKILKDLNPKISMKPDGNVLVEIDTQYSSIATRLKPLLDRLKTIQIGNLTIELRCKDQVMYLPVGPINQEEAKK